MEQIFVRKKSQLENPLEEYIGLRYEFPQPYHLYLHKGDIDLKSPLIRFIVMSMGSKRIVMLGYYRQNNKSPFHVSYSCRYKTSQLINYTRSWSEDFEMTLVATKNRITSTINQYLGTQQNRIISDRKEYEYLKSWLILDSYSKYYRADIPDQIKDRILRSIPEDYIQKLRSEIPQFQIMSNIQDQLNNPLFLDVDQFLQLKEDLEILSESVVSLLEKELQNYEKNINIIQEYTTHELIKSINKEFYDWISKSKYSSSGWYSQLNDCICTKQDDAGCYVESWGKNPDLV